MRVKLLTYTPEPQRVIACAAKLCYSSKADIDSLWESLDDENVRKFIEKIIDLNHQSVLEHVSFTFAIEGVSRSLLAQITRHRLASFSVRSQRYCNEGEFKAIAPKVIVNNDNALTEFAFIMDRLQDDYKHFQEAYGFSNEVARSILPNACATRLIVTMNARELMHFFNERCCVRAESEIRTLAYKMLNLVKEVAPALFSKAGAKCTSLGYCPEDKMSCGKAPTLKEVMEVYHEQNS